MPQWGSILNPTTWHFHLGQQEFWEATCTPTDIHQHLNKADGKLPVTHQLMPIFLGSQNLHPHIKMN